MTIESSSAAGQSEFNGTTFYFCTTACKREFDEKPATYYGKPIQPEPVRDQALSADAR